MKSGEELSIFEIIPGELDVDKSVYRCSINKKEKYAWRVIYNYSDLLISCDKNIKDRIEKPLKKIYEFLMFCIKNHPSFLKSLSPIKVNYYFPGIIKKMCEKSSLFKVGPMAAVAGTVCEYIASELTGYCKNLIIENGGDLYIKSSSDLNVGVYLKNKYFKNKIVLKINSKDTPCGLCSSSGTFGHSLSLGKSDLSVVLASSPITADAAVTAIANRITDSKDIQRTINFYNKFKEIKGILIIIDDKIGIWGSFELLS